MRCASLLVVVCFAFAFAFASCVAPPPQDAGSGGEGDGGDVVDAGQGTSVACGDATCGPDEYCHDECLCCGIPGGTPASQQTCKPIPEGCERDDVCSCDVAAGGLCDEETRTVTTLCA